MREILFRGISEVTGEWAYGYLVKTQIKGNEYFSIIPYDDLAKTLTEKRWFQVIPETIGQYTGLTDKNGKKIFEGDILYDSLFDDNGLIVFQGGGFDIEENDLIWHCLDCDMSDFEVIGNIHDKPELLKEMG